MDAINAGVDKAKEVAHDTGKHDMNTVKAGIEKTTEIAHSKCAEKHETSAANTDKSASDRQHHMEAAIKHRQEEMKHACNADNCSAADHKH